MTLRTLVLMHPMDPRGVKLGGIETHVRHLLARSPSDFRVLFVGVDEIGDLPLGRASPIPFGETEILFLPVVRVPSADINRVAASIRHSLTLRFAMSVVRRRSAIRAVVGDGPASADVQRFEFALLPKMLGLKAAMMIHNEGRKDQQMDSPLKNLWFLHRISETLALSAAERTFCVNENILRRMKEISPRAAARSEVMPVSVDRTRFAPRPLDGAAGVFRLIYAGRLDSFKDPPAMFRVAAGVRERLHGRFEFHYVGSSDPARFPQSAALGDALVRHGYKNAEEVAAISARCHAGVLTSYFEGMPCYLLETLSLGRPFVALRLPQFEPLVVPGLSGRLVERTEPSAACEHEMVEAFLEIWESIRAGRVDPYAISRLTEPYAIENQFARFFAVHRELQNGRPARRPPPT